MGAHVNEYRFDESMKMNADALISHMSCACKPSQWLDERGG